MKGSKIMAKKVAKKAASKAASKADTKALAPKAEALPAFLQEEAGAEGYFDAVHVGPTLPRLLIVQGSSGSDLKEAVGEGGIILRPDNLPVVGAGEEVEVVPLFVFTTYEKRRDANDPEEGMVLQSTTDPESELAYKTRDSSQWRVPYGDGSNLHYTHCESINFVFYVPGTEDREPTQAVMSFSMTAHKAGRLLVQTLERRKGPNGVLAPYASRFMLSTAHKTKGRNEWYVPVFNNPESGPYVTQELYEELKPMAQTIKEAYDAGLLARDTEGSGTATVEGDEAPPVDEDGNPAPF